MKKAFLSIVVVLFLGSTAFVVRQSDKTKLAESMQRGENIYAINCANCHAEKGQGVAGAFPPLAKSDYLTKDPNRAMKQIIYGLKGLITVNGKTYSGEMPAQNYLSDQEIADVMNFVLNSWGNKNKKIITTQDAKAQR